MKQETSSLRTQQSEDRAAHDGAPSKRVLFTMLCALFAMQLGLAARGFDPHRTPPFSGRFSWSMFAGPLTGHCTHELRYTDASGRSLAWPALPIDSPVRSVLLARTPAEIVQLSWQLAPYADRDADLTRALDDWLTRFARTLQSQHPRERASLVSELRCASPFQPRFARTRRWEFYP